ncbi:hypothetical protein GGX14DRAFT_398365 [Mycena pura]|uniref:Uncharacterized protein n=1 Tax=Mycena pura TaxID=153505 RepID=A0AAD6V8P7_9AGAR|nr:hypothetical protein GGX14DRAFT_398365 [Mycena pura]
MTQWLERKEKILLHSKFIHWRESGQSSTHTVAPGIEFNRTVKMTKHPSQKSVSFDALARDYGAEFFRDAIARYVITANHPEFSARQVETYSGNLAMPFRTLPVYHKINIYENNGTGTRPVPLLMAESHFLLEKVGLRDPSGTEGISPKCCCIMVESHCRRLPPPVFHNRRLSVTHASQTIPEPRSHPCIERAGSSPIAGLVKRKEVMFSVAGTNNLK